MEEALEKRLGLPSALEWEVWSPRELLSWAFKRFHPNIGLACSFQHAVLIDLAVGICPGVRVFSIDTGRLPEETHECARDIERRFGIRIEWYFPRHDQLEGHLREHGNYSFRESVDSRRACCAVRKVEPLNRALSSMDAWITGLRRDQGGTRNEVSKIEVDTAHGGIIKLNPLADWTYDDVCEYVKKRRLPYNALFEKGYTSIGCACCTRPSVEGDSSRAGRWWWEDSEHKECGLHVRNWQI